MAKRYIIDPVAFENSEHESQARIRQIYENRPTPSLDTKQDNVLSKGLNGHVFDDIPCRRLSIDELLPYFDWKMLYAVWGFRYDSSVTEEALKLKADALAEIDHMRKDDGCVVRIAARFLDAHAEGDDIVADNAGTQLRLPMFRQESGNGLSLADFVDLEKSGSSQMGLFAISVHKNVHHSACDCDRCNTAEYESMLERSVRLTFAEAASSWLDEKLKKSIPSDRNDIKICKPAAGYSSCPDHSLKKDILPLLPGYEGLDIRFTESYAMIPDASICGFIFASPDACYPEIRNVSKDAVDRYAHRRGFNEEEKRVFLGHLIVAT